MKVQYQLAQIESGVFLITAKNRYDLAQLFVCAQEYYESSEPMWKGRQFNRDQFERWYSLNENDDQIYSYPLDWSGFNVPSSAIEGYYYSGRRWTLDSNFYDIAMMRIDSVIRKLVADRQPYYVIGALADDLGTLDHEMAHALYATNAEYKALMEHCIGLLPKRTYANLGPLLTSMGYDQSVHHDEIQANFATGLTNYFKGCQRYCRPFIEVFESFRRPLTPRFEIVEITV